EGSAVASPRKAEGRQVGKHGRANRGRLRDYGDWSRSHQHCATGDRRDRGADEEAWEQGGSVEGEEDCNNETAEDAEGRRGLQQRNRRAVVLKIKWWWSPKTATAFSFSAWR